MERKFTRILVLILLLAPLSPLAQQDAMYSQYMWNGLSINPAYAGSRDALSITGLARWQWIGIRGAPNTQTLSIHTPTPNRRNAFGLNLIHDKISYFTQTWANLSYAFRIPTKRGTLSLGLNGAVNFYRINWDEAYLIDPNDKIVNTYARNLFLPNAGFGVYYQQPRWFAGFSVPHLLVNSLNSNRPGIGISDVKKESALLARHYFLTAGVMIKLSEDVGFRPSFLYKYVYGAPMEFDLNASFLFKNRFWVGSSYRTRDGLVLMAEYQATRQLRIGYAYDYPFTALSGFTTGTHEIMIGYDFRFGGDAVISPRFF